MTAIAKPFCANCTEETGPFVMRPIGKNNGLVRICTSCDSDPPVAKTGPDRSYEPTGGTLSAAESTAGMRRAMGKDAAKEAALTKHYTMSPSQENKGKTDSDFAALQFDLEGKRRARIRSRGNRSR